jgi:hypothetical protein
VRYVPLALVVLAAAACGGEARHGWTRLPPPPGAAPGAVAVWTGDALFYWGGSGEYGGRPVGGLYDPEEDRWDTVPAAPIPGRSRAAIAWTGRQVVICCGEGGSSAAAYDLQRRSWRQLPNTPIAFAEPAAYVWTGRELIVWGSAAPRSPTREGAAYDPAANRWRRIADAPIDLSRVSAAWTGDEMIVLGDPTLSGRYARGLAYDPRDDKWRMLPRYPLSANASTVQWIGRELFAWDYELHAAAYDPARDEWRRLAGLPLHAAECLPGSVLVGDVVFAWLCSQAATLDVHERVWTKVPGVPRTVQGSPVAGGGAVYFVNDWAGRHSFWEYRL